MIMRSIREALKSLARNFAMTLASVFSTFFTLLLLGTFVIILTSTNSVANQLENETVINIYISDAVSSNESQLLEMNANIKALPYIESSKYYTKEEALDQFIDQSNSKSFEEYRDDNPLRAFYTVNVSNAEENIEKTARKAEKINGVVSVEYAKELTNTILRTVTIVRLSILVLAIALSIISAFIISNTIKLTINSRRREIDIMKLVGAKRSFIRSPFLIEGFLIGILGGMLALAILAPAYYILYERLEHFTVQITAITPFEFIGYLSIFLISVGALVGLFGSFLSIRRFLKWT